MNVASKELCQELFELSGWNDTHFWHNEASAVTEPTMRIWVVSDHEGGYDRCPAYDLGYLLRKLPIKLGDERLQLRQGPTRFWILCYAVIGDPYGSYETGANTPEDAACKLAIELFKQGILKRDGEAAA